MQNLTDVVSRASEAASTALGRVSDQIFGANGLEPAAGERRVEIIDPATLAPIGSFTDPTDEQVETIIAAANRAQRA